jgi:hypothetical protein
LKDVDDSVVIEHFVMSMQIDSVVGMFGTALVDPPHKSLASFILTSQMLDLSLRCVMLRDGQFALLWMECETMKEE